MTSTYFQTEREEEAFQKRKGRFWCCWDGDCCAIFLLFVFHELHTYVKWGRTFIGIIG